MPRSAIKITPSKEARKVFNMLSVLAGEERAIDHDRLVVVSEERRDKREGPYLAELVREGWVAPTPDGGIRIDL